MRLSVDRFKIITSKNLDKSVKVVLISDMHIAENIFLMNMTNIKSTIRGVKKLGKIDLFAFCGDFVNNAHELTHDRVEKNLRFFVKELSKIAPVVLVRGNHDLYMNTRKTEEIYSRLGNIENVHLLDNSQMELYGMVITGFTPRHESYDLIKHGKRSHKITIEDFLNAKFEFDEKKFNLILTHSPYSLTNKRALLLVPEVFEKGDLILSGHLHNGLFASANFDVFKKFVEGNSRLKIKKALAVGADKGFWTDPKTGFVTRHCRGAKIVGNGEIGNTILPSSKTPVKIDLRTKKNKAVQITGKGINKFSVIPIITGRPSIALVEIKSE